MGELVPLADHRPTPRPGGNKKGTRRRFGNLRKLPSGRWQASYQGPDGKRHNGPTTFQTKGDAGAWLAMQDAAITERRWRPPDPSEGKPAPQTFTAYADRWLNVRDLKPLTRKEYSRMLRSIGPDFDGETLADMTPERIRDWWAGLCPDHPTERAHRYALVRTVLSQAVADGVIEANPCTVRGAGQTHRAREITVAEDAEITALHDAMPARLALAVTLGVWCSLRWGECSELRRADIDTRRGVVHVRRGVTWVKGCPVVGLPKSEAGIRDVSVPPHVVAEIRAHMRKHVGKGPDALLFPSAQDPDRQINHSTFYEFFMVARKEAGRPDLTYHMLRHTGLVKFAQAGGTTKELMARAGQTTPAMAMRYQHVAAGRDAEIARRMSEMATKGKE